MAEGIPGPPNQYPFGFEFDYSVWTPGTVVDLVNVNWNNDYRDVVKFENRAALNAYIDGKVGANNSVRFSELSYIKPGQPVKLPLSKNKLNKYNYIRVSNPLQPIEGGDEIKYYYYFILDTEYVSPNNTRLIIQLDVWQTYIYDIKIGNCYVERGHIGIANQNNFSDYGRNYLTTPEGFDLGNEYKVIGVKARWVLTPNPGDFGINSRYPGFDILVVSTADLTADPGTTEAPNLNSATGSVFQGTMHGANIYVFTADQFFAFMSAYSETPWVTQAIVSITMIPKVRRYHPDFEYDEGFATPAPVFFPKTLGHEMFQNWRTSPEINNYIPAKYRHLNKFKTYPYMAIEMTTFHGTPLLLKPEIWNQAHAEIDERASLVPPGQRIEFMPRFYNSIATSEDQLPDLWPSPITGYEGEKGDDTGEYLDMVTQIANLPTMAIVNNGAIGYLAANTHGITYQRQSADWSQQRALGQNQAQYDVATGAMHTAMSNTGSGVNADIAATANQNRTLAAQAIANAAGAFGSGVGQALTPSGFAGSAISGSVQAGVTAANAGIQTASNDEGLAIRNRQAAETTIATNKQSQLMRDTNKDVSDWAARGDYSNAIDAVNARVQDAALIQPTTSGQMGGETINIVNGGLQISLRWKMIDQATIRAIGDIWLRFGYKIQSFIQMPETFQVMTRFTYWKVMETYITAGNVPEGYKQAIRGIFEKGVTVWAHPDIIGDFSENQPLGGVSY